MASWPVHMTTGWHRFSPVNSLSGSIANIYGIPQQAFDAMTQATPLTLVREGPRVLQDFGVGVDALHRVLYSPELLKSLFLGNIGGVIGETSALLLLVGGVVLLVRRVITWHIPVSFIGTVAAVYFIFYTATGFEQAGAATLFQVLSGGLFLGAFFMATDMVTSPVTGAGMLMFGAGCGLITFVIRTWGGYPEGVSYSILIMNALVPLIDRYVKPKVFGT
jgi:Na+-translocating ferredoxin:NAD+ oxidoreductase subunit D